MTQRGASKPNESVLLSQDELVLINNALNEILNGPGAIDDWEFHSRVGVERSDAEVLMKRLAVLIKKTQI